MNNLLIDKAVLNRSRAIALLLSLFYLLYLFVPVKAHASALYESGNCYYSYDYGDREQFGMVVRTIGDVCRKRCERECGAFSRLDGAKELNQDIIDKCLPICRGGDIFSSKIRVKSKNPYGANYKWKGPYSSATHCSRGNSAIDAAGNNEYESDMVVKSQEKIKIKLLYPPGFGANEIFMCGKESIHIEPKFTSMEFNTWNANRGKWQNRDTSPDTWNARNNHLTDTGIDLKDGDYLSITYGGEFRHWCSNSTRWCDLHNGDLNLYVRNPNRAPPYQPPSFAYPRGRGNWWENEAFPGDKRYLYTIPGDKLQVITTDASGRPLVDPVKVFENNEKVKWFGLTARAYQRESKEKPPTFPPVPPNWMEFDNGSTKITRHYRVQSFSGILEGFSNRWTRLGIKHFDNTSWDNNLGGNTVDIDWKGCIYSNGERLQYGVGECIADCDTDDPDTLPVYANPGQWYDVSKEVLLEYKPISMPSSGKIFFRIKPLPYDPTKAPNCPSQHPICQESITSVANKYTPAHTFGQYFIAIERNKAEDLTSNVVSKIVTTVREYLFGKEDEEGTVQFLFNRFVADSALVDAIRALLVLYIAFTGLSFMAGMAQFTQKEGIERLIKIGLVVALLSPNSWEFFNTYLFRLFTDGGLELIAKFATGPGATPETFAKIEEDPALLFTIFDRPFSLLFGKIVWLKAVALMMSSFLGFLMTFVLVFAAVTYAICMAKATLIYLVSLIGIAILLILAPLFISLVLFKFTRQLFEAWLKQLLSFVFQPLLVLTAIGILNNLLLIGVYTSFGFTACESCFIGITIPFKEDGDICLIPGMVALIGAHHPPGAVLSSPLLLVGSIFYFMIIAQAMYVFCDFGVRIANQVVTGAFVGVELSAPAAAAASTPMSWGRTALTYTLGVDSKARDKRKKIIKRAESVKEKLSKKKPPKRPEEPNPNPNPEDQGR